MATYELLTVSASRTVLGTLVLSVVLSSIMGVLRRKRWSPEGKHVLITGGSQGLGLAVAELLASKGANVTICSRTESKLREALDKVKVSFFPAFFVPHNSGEGKCNADLILLI